jgi:hypothetical protein
MRLKMSQATTLSTAPSLPAPNVGAVRLSATVRVMLYAAFVVLGLPLFAPHLNIPISGLPFGLADYVFFGAGLLGFLVVPRQALPATIPVWTILGWCGALLFAAAFAVEREVALKQTVSALLWGSSAMGLARFSIDPAIRRFCAIVLLIIGVRWGIYAAGAFQEVPALADIAAFGLQTTRLINHNAVAVPIAAGAGLAAGYFIGQSNRRGYLLAASVVALGVLTISFCLSRQGVVALLVGTAIAVLRSRKVTRGLFGLAIIAGVIAFIVVQAQERGIFGARAGKVEDRYDPFNTDLIERTTGQRARILEKGVTLATNFPGGLVGIGGGNFPYVTETGERRYTRGPVLHNEHFTILLEAGILGFVCWLALLRKTVLAPVRHLRLRPLDFGFITAGTVHVVQLLFVNALGLTFWWIIACVAGAIAAGRLELERLKSA